MRCAMATVAPRTDSQALALGMPSPASYTSMRSSLPLWRRPTITPTSYVWRTPLDTKI
jgi:hypothetical protein